jgi:hypothetical protein
MQPIDALIESFALLSLIYLTAEFIRFSANRGSGRRVAPAAQPDRPQFNHIVVPFHRPATRPEPPDRELIQLAKSTDYPGSKKWSYKRQLSSNARAELLRLWQEVKAG